MAERAGRLARQKVQVVPYGADVAAMRVGRAEVQRVRRKLGVADDELIVAGIGRFVRWKGFDFLLDAFARAREDVPGLRLVLVGDGDLRDELESQARSLGVFEMVAFVGMASRDEIPAHLGAADVVAVPSVRHSGYVDGLPNVALEALAAGKPLVASDAGGLPDLVKSGENGLLVPEKDSSALAQALVTLARDAELRARLGANGRTEILGERSWDAVGRRFDEIYARVLAER
jgi:glycosyltransferase involved in cell wall biosynthesis